VRVDLVTCTDGAEGEIHDPTLDVEEARPRLAHIRADELACSIDALGGGAIHHHLLGYRDSGMMGTDPNDHPESFWQADVGEATRRLVEIVRRARPAAIVDVRRERQLRPPGPHQRGAHRAGGLPRVAGDPVGGLALLRDRVPARRLVRADDRDEGAGDRAALGHGLGVDAPPADELNPSNAAALGQVAESLEEGSEASWEESFGRSDEEVTTRVDVSAFLDAKRRSMDCHKTQRQDLGWMLDLPPDLADRVLATECYVLRWLDGAEVPSSHRETSLLPTGQRLG
jgi:LmbE family N-acetylglucosaminyl deacetylase